MSHRIIWALLAVSGCGGDPGSPEAAVAISVQEARSPDADGLAGCPHDRRLVMFPQQSATLDSHTSETDLERRIETTASGVNCHVASSGDRYQIDISIDADDLDGVGIFEFSTLIGTGTATSSGDVYWLNQGVGLRGACAVIVDAAADGESFIEPGKAKLTFACDPVRNGDAQACGLSGTVYVTNCAK
jgi:hypothetical protein